MSEQVKKKLPLDVPMEKLLNTSVKAVAKIEESAEELGLVHAVLSGEITPVATTQDAQLAVEHTKQIQEELEATAAELKRAAEALKGKA
ncbi:MAG: hypothetical protein V4646_15925 [Pseudomonadota bacterium]